MQKKLIDDAKKYGADAVKFQTFSPETMTLNSHKKDFLIKEGIWKGNNLWKIYEKAQTPLKWHKELFNYSKKKNNLFKYPFDETAVNFLEKLKCPIYKVSSFEMTDIPLIKRIAQTRKPIIMSTGMANLKEIETSYNIAIKMELKK